jgi:site-specific DNA-cytosine methylase
VEYIIAHPPCTEFAVSGARWWKEKAISSPQLLENAINLVKKTIEIIQYHKPRVFFIENPMGRIEKCVPTLLKYPKWSFDPYEYARYADNPNEEAYTKKTILWGNYQVPETRSLFPILGSKMWSIGGWCTDEIKELRSITPQGFARAFIEANLKSQLTLF